MLEDTLPVLVKLLQSGVETEKIGATVALQHLTREQQQAGQMLTELGGLQHLFQLLISALRPDVAAGLRARQLIEPCAWALANSLANSDTARALLLEDGFTESDIRDLLPAAKAFHLKKLVCPACPYFISYIVLNWFVLLAPTLSLTRSMTLRSQRLVR